jgi:hypothetical protein
MVSVSQAGSGRLQQGKTRLGVLNESLRLLLAGVKSAMENNGRIILCTAPQRQSPNQAEGLFF